MMKEWGDIITITPAGTFPVVKLRGSLRLKLPSMESAFEEGAACSVDGAQYVFRDGKLVPAE